MATRTQYLTYYIVLTDADAVTANQTLYPVGVNRAPYDPGPPVGGAAIEFAAPFKGYAQLTGHDAPYIWTPWSGLGEQDGPYPLNVAKFTRHTGGFWGIGGTTITYYWVGQFVLAPQDEPSPENPPPPGVTILIPQRRWCEGFDVPGQICGSAAASLGFSRDASRHTAGMGLALRGQASSVNVLLSSFAGLGTPTDTWDRIYVRWRNAGSAPLPFMRWHASPSANAGADLALMPSGQLALENITAGNARSLLGTFGQLAIDEWTKVDVLTRFNSGAGSASGSHGSIGSTTVTEPGVANGVVDGVSTISVSGTIGTGVLGGGPFVITSHDTSPARTWVKITTGDFQVVTSTTGVNADDAVHQWYTALLGGGGIRLFINGVKVADLEVTPAAGGLGAATQTLAGVEVGNVFGLATDDTELDLDDWVSANIPLDSSGKENLGGVDFTQGSKVRLLRPTGFGAAHLNWVGDFRILLQNAIGTWTTKQVLTSSTSGAVMEATSDYAQSIKQDPQSLGPVAMQVVLQSLQATAGSGTLGYKIGAAAAVDSAIVQATSMQPNAVMYRPVNGTVLPTDFVSVLLRHVKAANANAAQVPTLLAMVEMVGAFGPEDVPATITPKPASLGRVGIHNAPYDRTPWALDAAAAPNAPVIITAGTYVGNDTGQDLSFRAPVHFLFIRNAAGSQPGGLWATSMLAAHRNSNLGVEAFYAPQALEDQTFVPAPGQDTQRQRYKIRIAGSDTQANQNTVVYQYIAVSDPGGRFLLNMATAHQGALASYVAALVDSGFTPEWAFFAFENLSNTATTFQGVKGPGHATESVTRFGGNTVTTALSLGAGTLTGKTAFWNLAAHLQVAFSLWRRHDGNNDPSEAAVVSVGSYVGDGAGSRTLSVGTAGKRPLFAIVTPENAAAVVRDPSHTGTTSQNLAGGLAVASAGISGGGVDSLSVGANLNANGVTHHYFVLWGSATAGNGGWSVNGEFIPVEATSPVGGLWPPDPNPDDFLPPAVTTPTLPAEPDLDPDTPLPGTDLFCADFTLKLVNQALSRIGVNKRIKNLVMDTTIEASTARLHIKQDVEATLRRYPWPFATRYADLVVVGGTVDDAVNQDWQYSYRAPADMVYARRLVNQAGLKRGPDPDPPSFRFSTDDNGGLVYADADVENENLSLEYTQRNRCPAFFGDAIFRDALIWRIGASLAPSLSKDSKKADYCLAQFERVLSSAETVAANEARPEDDISGDAPWIRDRG